MGELQNISTPSVAPSSTQIPDQGLPFDIGSASLASGVVLSVFSPTTVLANGLLLLAIYRDPTRTFGSPTACFLIGLAVTDLITGLVPEPMVAACYFLVYSKHPLSATCSARVFPVAGVVASITTNSTFLLVLAFTVAQYVAVSCPINYKRFINTKRTVLCVLLIWSYTAIFELLGQVGVPHEVIEKVDLFLHSTLTIVLSVVMYTLLHRTFSRQMRRHTPSSATVTTTTATTPAAAAAALQARTAAEPQPKARRRNVVERKFVKINLLLISIFIFCSLPSAITWYIYFYWPEMRNSRAFFIARVIVDNTLYLKFVLDPFVYAWRLPKYRQALVKAITCDG